MKKAVLLIAFNRPHLTERVFRRIRDYGPKKLYFSVDGPRSSRPEEESLCRRTRDLVMGADLPFPVVPLFRQENLGCRIAVSSAIDWFFQNETDGIILEDDCLPDPSFFGFCERLLEDFADRDRVMKICGYNPLPVPGADPGCFFSNIGWAWGWATWRRAWAHFDLEMESWPVAKELGVTDHPPFWESRNRIFEATSKGLIDTWDFQWDYSIAIRSGLCVLPTRNLVENIGFGPDATHSDVPPNPLARRTTEGMPLDFVLPRHVIPDLRYDRSLVRLNHVGLFRRIWNRLVRRFSA